MTNEATDMVGGQLSYAADSFGASITYANLDTATAWGLNGYYTFDSTLPSISLGSVSYTHLTLPTNREV